MLPLELSEEQLRTLQEAAAILGVAVDALPTALQTATNFTNTPPSSHPLSTRPLDWSAAAQPLAYASRLSGTSDRSVPTAYNFVPITSTYDIPEFFSNWKAEVQAPLLSLSDISWGSLGHHPPPFAPQLSPRPTNTTHFDWGAVPLSFAGNAELDFVPTSNDPTHPWAQETFTPGFAPSQLTNTVASGSSASAGAGADFLCDHSLLDLVGNEASLDFPQSTSNYSTSSSAKQQPTTHPTARHNGGIRIHRPIRPHSTRGGAFSLSGGIRKRKAYNEAERHETGLTRSMRMCMKCRLSRKRCIPDPLDPEGPCLPCQKVVFNTFNLPCLRYKITDCYLYRTVSNDSFGAVHAGSGPRFGDFHLRKIWIGDENEIRTFALSQRRGTSLNLRVRQFEPPIEPDESTMDSKGIGGKGRSYYSIPWAIANLDEAIKAVNDFIDESTLPYIDNLVDDSSSIASTVFEESRRLAYGRNPNILIRQTLRLWVASRFLEGGWRCAGKDMLGAENMSPSWRSKDDIALPPYIDFQFASIIMEVILGPLRRDVLKRLEEMVLKNQSKNWFTIFLVIFILMHSYELILQHEVAYTTRRKYSLKYYDMKLIRGYQSGAKTLLAHFHHINKGNIPFQPQFDWNSPINRRMADLSEDEFHAVTRVSLEVSKRAELLQHASTTDSYEEPFWFIGQVFDKTWKPRDTCEHSPPLGVNNEN